MSKVIAFPRSATKAIPTSPIPLQLESIIEEWRPPMTWRVDDKGTAWLTDAEYAPVEAFFGFFGFDVERRGPLDSFIEGWSYLVSRPRKFLRYFQHHRAVYSSLTRHWQEVDHRYLEALARGEVLRVRELAPRTRFARELQDVMRSRKGSALKATEQRAAAGATSRG
jgi:hypothetical protein